MDDERLGLVVEQPGDLGGQSREDRAVEERVKSGEQECADDDGNENLHAGVNIALRFLGCDNSLELSRNGIHFVFDFLKHDFHLTFLCGLDGSALVVEEILNLRGHGRHDRGVEERIETGEQECADDDGNENLHTGVHITLGFLGCEGGLCLDCDGIDLVFDFLEHF